MVSEMTDLAFPEPKRMADVSAESRSSVPAILAYSLTVVWTLMLIGIYTLIRDRIPINVVMLTIVASAFGTQTTLMVAAYSFWVGATQGGKQANERLSEASKLSNAALQKAVDGAAPVPAPGTAIVTAAADVDATVTVTDAGTTDDGELPPDQRVQP